MRSKVSDEESPLADGGVASPRGSARLRLGCMVNLQVFITTENTS